MSLLCVFYLQMKLLVFFSLVALLTPSSASPLDTRGSTERQDGKFNMLNISLFFFKNEDNGLHFEGLDCDLDKGKMVVKVVKSPCSYIQVPSY